MRTYYTREELLAKLGPCPDKKENLAAYQTYKSKMHYHLKSKDVTLAKNKKEYAEKTIDKQMEKVKLYFIMSDDKNKKEKKQKFMDELNMA